MKMSEATSSTFWGTISDPAGSCHTQPNPNLKPARERKQIPRLPLKLLLLGGLLLAWAGNALAVDWVKSGSGVIYYLSSTGLGGDFPGLAPGDTITIRNGAILGCDADVTIAKLTLGDATTPGKAVFASTGPPVRTLTVTGDVVFGPSPLNQLDMGTDVFAPAHVLRVKGAFLAGGGGTFKAGNGWVDYCANGPQNVTATIGGTTIDYKNLAISSDGATSGTAIKMFAAGVTVNAVLKITERAVPAGPAGAVIYKTDGRLLYFGAAGPTFRAQTTTPVEWTGVMAAPVTIDNLNGVTLNENKSISGLLTLQTAGTTLNDGGFVLTVLGNIDNGVFSGNYLTKHLGTGKILLLGTTPQTLAGNGSYGNVTLNNAAGATLTSTLTDTDCQPRIAGRLILQTGKLTIPSDGGAGQNHHVSLLSYGSPPTDKAANTYGSSMSSATMTADSAFEIGSPAAPKGMLTVNPKPAGYIAVNPADNGQHIIYGTPTMTVRGTVVPPTNTCGLCFSDYGNTALAGDIMSVTIKMPFSVFPFFSGDTLIGTGVIKPDNKSFEVVLNTLHLPACEYWLPIITAYDMMVQYDLTTPVPQNLAGNTLGNTTAPPGPLTVVVDQRFIVVTPKNVFKIYGELDDVAKVDGCSTLRTFPYDFTTGALVNGDTCVGEFYRHPGEGVGSYPIEQGTFNLSRNYDLVFIEGKSLTILQKPITVTPDCGISKTYGTADPPLTFTATPSLTPILPGDQWYGSLHRAMAGVVPAGERAGTYAIDLGTLNAGSNYVVSFSNPGSGYPPTPCVFTINKLHVVATGRSDTKVYGEKDPASLTSGVASIKLAAFPFTDITGALPWGDTTSGSTTREVGENVRVLPLFYAVQQGAWVIDQGTNYIVDWVDGQFQITPRPVYVTGDCDATKNYGDPNPTLWFYENVNGVDATARGLITTARSGAGYTATVPGQSLLAGVGPTWVTPLGEPLLCSMPGVYRFTLGGNTDGNYAPTYQYHNDATPIPPQPTGGFCIEGSLTIQKCPMRIVADNKTKVSDLAVFNALDFTSTYWVLVNGTNWVQGFKCSDTSVSSFCPAPYDGTLHYEEDYPGNAVAATQPGVYEIRPHINCVPVSPQYDVTFVSGYLTITPPTVPANQTVTGPVTWGAQTGPGDFGGCSIFGTPSLTWFADNAMGTAGASNGWSVLTVNGTLTIAPTLTPTCPFRLDLVTLTSPTLGRMHMFDPTRPYRWLIVHTTGGIVGFNPAKIRINSGIGVLPDGTLDPFRQMPDGSLAPDLFANPTFFGRFDVTSDGTDMWLNFTPKGPTGGIALLGPQDPLPNPPATLGQPEDWYVNAGKVGPLTDPTTLVGDTATHDVDTLWLFAENPNLAPQDTLVVDLNVTNLHHSIYGVQAYINFSSLHYVAAQPPAAGAPIVQAGGGVWEQVIYKMWDVGGDLDTVIGVTLTNGPALGVGTSDGATVARIYLTPKKTYTGSSRVVFRHDGDPSVDKPLLGSAAQTGDPLQTVLFMGPGEDPILPARIMTDLITISNDLVGPVFGSITATQVQAYADSLTLPGPVSVKNPPSYGTGKVTVRTFAGVPNAEATTSNGPVIITVSVADAGVGLAAPPNLLLTRTVGPAGSYSLLPLNTTSPFIYRWPVNTGDDGEWEATATFCDTALPVTHCTAMDPFKLVVNTYQVTGVVELEGFKGTNRVVTFKAGDASSATPSNTWNLNLKFTSTPILNDGGNYQDKATLASRLFSGALPPSTVFGTDPLSTWLRYGGITNDPAGLRTTLRSGTRPVDQWIYRLTYGSIPTGTFSPAVGLGDIVAKLTSPTMRNVDQWVLNSVLSPSTITAMASYISSQSAANVKALKQGILEDFNRAIGSGASLWSPVRFDLVTLTGSGVWPYTLYYKPIVELAVALPPNLTMKEAVEQLNRALLVDAYPSYAPGEFPPETGIALTDNTAMMGPYLMKAFDDLTINRYFKNDPTHRSIPSYSPVGLYISPQTAPAVGSKYAVCVYYETNFATVALRTKTTNELWATIGPVGTALQLAQLNQDLLQDAYAGWVQSPQLKVDNVWQELVPGTLTPLLTASTFDDGKMQRDLNAVIYGPSIWGNTVPVTPAGNYTSLRFSPWTNSIPGTELAVLLSKTPAATGPDLARMNRLLLELGYDTELSKSVLAPYILINAPKAFVGSPWTWDMNELSAKTAWNLRVKLNAASVPALAWTGFDMTAYFVNNGTPLWQTASPFDYYLRGGDCDASQDNKAYAADYNQIRLHFNLWWAPADINGNGKTEILDYLILRGNWARSGDLEVQ